VDRDQPSCPQCGGALGIVEESGFALCGFCGSSLYFDPGRAVAHQILTPVLPAADVPALIERWLSGREAVGRARDVTAALAFYPFWVLPEGSGSRLEPAAPLLLFSSEPIHLPSGDLKAYHPELAGSARVVPASVLLDSLLPAGEPAPKGTRLVHVPLWEVSYRVFAGSYQALVDASEGQVLPLSSPPSSERWLDWAHAAVLTALFLVVFRGFRSAFLGWSALGFLEARAHAGDRLVETLLGLLRLPSAGAADLAVAGPAAWLFVFVACRLRARLSEVRR